MTQRITIDPITRLEGHGKIDIFLDDKGDVERAYLQVPELRGFEVFSLGRPAEDMPQITSRICGVCPTAHHMAGTKALDDLYKVTPPPAARKIRELVYSTFMLEDHALHVFVLGGPDFIVGPEAPPAERNILGVVAKVGVPIGSQVIQARAYAQTIQATLMGKDWIDLLRSRTLVPVLSAYVGPLAPMTLKEIAEPSFPAPDWLTIRTRLCGLYGSDYKQVFLKGRLNNPMTALISFPHVLGHEVVGVIEAVGPAVRTRRVGERVVLNPWLSCAPRGIDPACGWCARGEYAQCENFTRGVIDAGIHTGNSRHATGGFAPLSYSATLSTAVFYDMIYAHEPTPFLAPALECGRRAIDGAGMLLHQGELAFELFNEVAPPAGVMRAALMTALGRG